MLVLLATPRVDGAPGQPQTEAALLGGGIQDLPTEHLQAQLDVDAGRVLPIQPDLCRLIAAELLDDKAALAGKCLPIDSAWRVAVAVWPRSDKVVGTDTELSLRPMIRLGLCRRHRGTRRRPRIDQDLGVQRRPAPGPEQT
jgi:hypothetical protein